MSHFYCIFARGQRLYSILVLLWRHVRGGRYSTCRSDRRTVASGDPVAYDYSAFYDVSAISTIMNTALSLASLPTDAKTADDAWYTLDGRRLNGRPTQRGVYVNNRKKVVIKVGS